MKKGDETKNEIDKLWPIKKVKTDKTYDSICWLDGND